MFPAYVLCVTSILSYMVQIVFFENKYRLFQGITKHIYKQNEHSKKPCPILDMVFANVNEIAHECQS